MTETK